ncbi:MAG: FecR domain-containing protein [Pseudomonas putida]|jgi:ferric-dicitrate binding protein FerR (iron transport regulator)|nr:FecR domain-containing protein [Pseudomonas putida]
MSPTPALQPQAAPEREALEWFSRLRHPGCDERQRQAFAAWCQAPENARAYAELEACWQQLTTTPRPRVPLVQARRSHAGTCLAVLFLLILAGLAYEYWPQAQRLGSDLYTDSGERRSVRLADGTTLHLDGASALDIDLRERTRQMQLIQGQVYLEVMLDGRALQVQVDDARIEVYGSRLMLARHSTYDELVVLNGKAMVLQGGDQRMVSAGERVTFTDARIGQVGKIDVKTVDAWRNGHLLAREMLLGEVLERLAGYQGRRVWLLDEQTAQRRISGDFDLDHPSHSLERLADEQHLRLYGVLGRWLVVR